MLPLDVRHLAFLGWAALNTGLAVVIGDRLDWGGQPHLEVPEPVTMTAEPVTVTLPADFTLPAAEKHFRQTLERPLFVPSRRPPPPPPPPPPPEPPPKPTMQKGQFQLMGTMILPEASYVVLRDVASGKTRRVEQGQTINGILIQSVEPERATLSQYDDIEVLVMKVAPSPKTASPAAVVPPAAAVPPGNAAATQAARALRRVPARN